MKLVRLMLLMGLVAEPLWAGLAVNALNPVVPALRNKEVNPLLGFTVDVPEGAPGGELEAVEVVLAGTTRLADLSGLALLPGTPDPAGKMESAVATVRVAAEKVVFRCKQPLKPGANTFWISVALKDTADIDGRVAMRINRIRAGGEVLNPVGPTTAVNQRVGIALRQRGDDGSHSYRIPGLARSKAGTLLAVYDIRYKHCGDLPARVDVGVMRSPDGGQTWSPQTIAMHPGTMGDAYAPDGVGDPAVLVDEITGRIWLAALWSHGNRAWNGSGPGMTPDETGQFLLTHSDDDGKSWAPLRNITPMVKDPSWRLCFNGPGAGICMKDGTLVFPAQFRAADGGETKGKPFSTVIVSTDRGETWRIGSGARIDTTEAQVAELADGALMLNCRDNRGGSRTVVVSRDLGKTWEPHASDRKALPEPVCMASLLRWDHPKHGTLLAFSNPNSTRGRNHMTVKISRDLGLTWPENLQALYDVRNCSGYSCLAPAGPDHLGVLYEGNCELYFLRVPLGEGGTGL